MIYIFQVNRVIFDFNKVKALSFIEEILHEKLTLRQFYDVFTRLTPYDCCEAINKPLTNPIVSMLIK